MTMSQSNITLAAELGMKGYVCDEAESVWHRIDEAPFSYSDGDEVEQRILDVIENAADVSLFSATLRQHQVDWPSTYHLSAVRANLLRPLSALLAHARILEVGAGCGAVTRFPRSSRIPYFPFSL